MTRAQKAHALGRIAYIDGHDLTACTSRTPLQRAHWLAGYEQARKERLSGSVSEAQIAESADAINHLKTLAKNL